MRDHCTFISTLIQRNGYSSSLGRLRIDQIDFYEDVLDGFFTRLGCDKIKILMLYPWPRPTSFSKLKLTYDLKTFKEGRVAMNVALQDLPELRILVIGGFQFWVERSPPESEEVDAALSPRLPNLRLWHLSQAEKDPYQSIDIKQWLTGRDRYFMSTSPRPRVQDSWARSLWKDESGNCLLQRVPCLQMIKHRNYMVLHRDDGCDPLPTLSQRPPTEWLADLATWNLIWCQ